MGIEIVLEDANGGKISSLEDPENILHRVLPAQDDQKFQCLNRVDWYGDTTFNRYQIPILRQELRYLTDTEGMSLGEQNFIKELDSLAARALSEPHFYLKFYGD